MTPLVLVILRGPAGITLTHYVSLRELSGYVRGGWRVAQRDEAERAAHADALRIQAEVAL